MAKTLKTSNGKTIPLKFCEKLNENMLLAKFGKDYLFEPAKRKLDAKIIKRKLKKLLG